MIDDEAGAGFSRCFAPDTASDDEALGLVVMEAVLPMPPVVTGAGFLGSSTPDTAVTLNYGIITGASVCGSCAPDTASNYRIKRDLLGPVRVW